MSQVDIAKVVGISQGTYAQAEKSGQGSAFTTQLAAATGVNADWLATGQGEMLQARSSSEEFDLDAHPDLERIRKVKLRLQAGVNGFAIEADEGDGMPIFFRSEWLRERGYKPYKLIAIKVTGQSMEPNLYPDDMVVINTADTEPKDGKVFAVNYEGEPVIKRLVRDGGTWWLLSDNPDQRRFPKKECTDGSCIIVGQIIHKQSEQI
ncbi:S24 family peptidase [Variovorax sp. GB1P17]|uniref:S24 family peptidase n=1 Tax=Variovorax sp. GB1P17 TaxID=3443740 RepID=UPI003F482B41